MDPSLSLQITVCVLAGNQDRDRTNPRLFTLFDVDDLALEPASFDPTLVHSEQDVSPMTRFGATRSRMNGHISIVLTEFTGKQHLQLDGLEFFQDRFVFCF